MSDLPFGFSSGDSSDDDERRKREEEARQQGEGQAQNPFGFGGFDAGQGFDPAQLGNMLSQLGQMISGMGGAMNDPASAASGDPVNYQLAMQLARQALGKHAPVSEGQRKAVEESVHLAQLWLDGATVLPAGPQKTHAWTPVDWLEKTLPTWKRLVNPVAEKMSNMWVEGMPEEARQAAAPMMGMFTQIGSMSFGTQLGQGLGQLSKEVLTSTDIGLPLGPTDELALLPEAIEAFSKELEQSDQEILVFLAAREAAYHRLFSHVPWLRQRLLDTVEQYARGIQIDMSGIEELSRGLDPSVLSDPAALERLMAEQSAALEPKATPEQKAALERLEALLALIEGWVETVVHRALADRLPSAGALRETMRRRRASGGPAEQTFGTLVGLELRPRKVREAATLWERLFEATSMEKRDAVWGHPDLMPDSSDLDDPSGFVDRQIGGSELDDPIAELERQIQREAAERDDQDEGDQDGPGDESSK
ncbi:zinc-dependent metalloprotease [Tsukamurella sp. 8F]|uniref:zinc-dependent metalloprotease n=1 Tax=unclassified Tsukamurella TaxID=2633480 RepID=UPI0023B98EA3|nr:MULTISPECIES: zinc-dependent metalloprotease [unclassified Tsukamurella]MDF0528884.1 zinc-dependent metalloprotease [Tsukamurella sp. 8J]MDF0586719.1 zinc-dependent metalloprotease [Tsukamurella sp. 8F]